MLFGLWAIIINEILTERTEDTGFRGWSKSLLITLNTLKINFLIKPPITPYFYDFSPELE
jgi:hypothetical protein